MLPLTLSELRRLSRARRALLVTLALAVVAGACSGGGGGGDGSGAGDGSGGGNGARQNLARRGGGGEDGDAEVAPNYEIRVRVDGKVVKRFDFEALAALTDSEGGRGDPGPTLADVLSESGVARGDGTKPVAISGDRGEGTFTLAEVFDEPERFQFAYTRRETVKLEIARSLDDVFHVRNIVVGAQS